MHVHKSHIQWKQSIHPRDWPNVAFIHKRSLCTGSCQNIQGHDVKIKYMNNLSGGQKEISIGRANLGFFRYWARPNTLVSQIVGLALAVQV